MKQLGKFLGAAGFLGTAMAWATVLHAAIGSLALDDLWEDTPATRSLSHSFRIYKRIALPNRLHRQLRLYLVHPEQAKPTDRRPAVVFIHGGGWGAGDADQWFPQCRYFALRGLIGVSIDYRLKTDATTIAECVIDCKSAVRACAAMPRNSAWTRTRSPWSENRPAATWRPPGHAGRI